MDFQFYKTTNKLVKRAWGKFQNRNYIRLLDACAGDGTLAEGCHDGEERYRRREIAIDCIEIDVGKHPLLREKGFNVVGLDFLRFGSGSLYSHVILNPPFHSGVKHVLKAWDIVFDAEIVAIINAETVRNPFSAERQMLVRLIEQHGSVEYITGAFAGVDADRQTDVEIALVYLRKQANVANDIFGDLLAEMQRDTTSQKNLAGEYREANALMLPNSVIENSVVAFKAAVRSMREAVFSEARAGYYMTLLGETMAVRNGDGAIDAVTKSQTTTEWVLREVGKRYDELKDRAWSGILRSSNVTSRLSSSAQARVEKEFKQISQLEFTAENIYAFLCGIAESQGTLQLDMACDCFDKITKYHDKNTIFFKGWKSNTKHYCGMKIRATRFILPGHGGYGSSRSLSWESERLMSDFDKVFAMLDGQREPEYSLVQLFRDRYSDLRNGARLDSSYFSIRYFPGAGTIHFFPRDPKLIDRLNRVVGRQRSWLPPEGTKVSDAFWLQFDSAEKFDVELRKALQPKAGQSRWNHPLQNLIFGDEDRREAAEKAIDEAIGVVLERHGIKTDFLIEAQTEPAQGQEQMLLLAA